MRPSSERSTWFFCYLLIVAALLGICGCGTEIEGPTPKVAANADPSIACNAQGTENAGVRTTIRITSPDGSFSALPIDVLDEPDLVLPRVFLVGPAEVELPDVHYIDARTIEVLVVAANAIPAGTYQFVVENPDGQRSVPGGTLRVVDPPVVTGVTAQSGVVNGASAQICTTIDNVLTITGTGFRPGDPPPTVEILTCTDPSDPASCTLVATATDVQVVDETTITATLPSGAALPPGTYAVRVTNPEAPPCTGTSTTALVVVAPPTVTGIDPATICTLDAGVTITGTGFHDPMTATIGDQPVGMTAVTSDTTLTGVAPNLAPGTYDLVVTSPEGCSDTLVGGVTYAMGVTVTISTVVPKQGWNGIDNPVQIFGSGFVAGVTVYLAGAAMGGGDLTLIDVAVDPSGTRIDATVPAGGAPGGPYDLVVVMPNGCEIVLPAAFTILGMPSLSITDVIPPFGWTGAKTPVTIKGTDFQSTPKAYLVIPTMTPTLVPLDSTAFVNDTALTSVVPQGLDVGGPYDLVVINPDGGGGLLAMAFRVTNLPPPTIDNVTPGAGTTQNDTDVTITGCNFRDPATVDAVATSGALTAATVTAAPVCNGLPGCADNTNHCTMAATVPTATMAVAPYVIRVTNTDEVTWGDWSVFVVTQPSAKLDVWTVATGALVTGRRSAAGVSGRIDNASRFLYAIGGDSGAAGAALDTVEVIPLDIFGSLGTPFQQQNKLGSARTRLGAVQSGRYVYAIGGSDGSTGLATVERAKILDDSDVPVVADVAIGAGTLAAGTWYYRVSAVKDANDPDNPSGETLPSDEVVVSFGIDGNAAILTWNAVAGAVAYRVYRTEAPNGTSTTEVSLVEVAAPTTTYTDDGTVAVDPTRTPLSRGSTGVWVPQAGSLLHARHGLRASIGHDPAGAAFVYAVGGVGSCSGGPDAAMSCYEIAPLTPDGATLGAWVEGATTLLSPRNLFGFAIGENANASQIPAGTTYLFACGGVGATSELEAAVVLAGGQLGPSVLLEPPFSAKPGARNGHGLQLANNALYLNGGVAGATASGSPLASTQFSVDFDSNQGVPARNSFSSSSVDLTIGRWEHSLILESGFFYAIGGSTNAGLTDATDSIESTIY